MCVRRGRRFRHSVPDALAVYADINPEPSEAERQAIVEALRTEQEETSAFSRWQRQGLELEAEDDYATTPRRQSLGATRA
jgi:hypothetical protein